MRILQLVIVSVQLSESNGCKQLSSQSISPDAKFELWKKCFSMEFAKEEEHAHAMKNFMVNELIINMHNQGSESTFTLGHNQFSHMSEVEWNNYIKNHSKSKPQKSGVRNIWQGTQEDAEKVSKIDWVEAGAVTKVKDQGQCGSCWAFSATGGIEGAWFVAGNPLTSVSEQQLVSCDTDGNDQGCNGGLPDSAFEQVENNNGITTEANQPYKSGNGSDGRCNKNKANQNDVKITGHTDVTPEDKSSLITALKNQPVSIGVDAMGSSWQLQSGGVMHNGGNSGCGHTQLDHGVLLVGQVPSPEDGSDPQWMVKNSWNATWGMDGYIHLALEGGNSGTCGLMTDPVFATA